MNPIEEFARFHPGFGAAPFQRSQLSVTTPLPPIRSGRPPSVTEPQPPVKSAAQMLHWMQVQQMEPAQTSAMPDYRWATLNVDAILNGHPLPAGRRIAVAPWQTTTISIGKAHLQTPVTKVWAKFGQTFDASSWIEGWLSPTIFTYTGQKATWNAQSGFGSLGALVDELPESAQKPATFGLGFLGGLVVGGLIGGVGVIVVYALAEREEEKREEEARYRRAGYSGR